MSLLPRGKARLHHPYNPHQCEPKPEGQKPGASCTGRRSESRQVEQMDAGRPPSPSLSRADDPFQDPHGEAPPLGVKEDTLRRLQGPRGLKLPTGPSPVL